MGGTTFTYPIVQWDRQHSSSQIVFFESRFLGSHTATQRAAMPPSEPLETCLQSLNMKLAQGLSETPYFCLQESQDHGPTQHLLSQPCGESS